MSIPAAAFLARYQRGLAKIAVLVGALIECDVEASPRDEDRCILAAELAKNEKLQAVIIELFAYSTGPGDFELNIIDPIEGSDGWDPAQTFSTRFLFNDRKFRWWYNDQVSVLLLEDEYEDLVRIYPDGCDAFYGKIFA